MKYVYLDNGASTMADPEAVKAMLPYFTASYANASSRHLLGQEAKQAMDEARRKIAKAIGAKEEEIVFTSGGTESNNLAIKGVAFACLPVGMANRGKKHIITTKIEHDCVLESCRWLASEAMSKDRQGWKITYLDVDKEGFIDLNELEKALTPETVLVSVIHGNNEIGTIQDIEGIGKICRRHNVYFHTDACQSFTKVPIDVVKMNVDLLTLNSHKIHGPKGVGALYVRKGVEIIPWNHGGGHENGLRSGTENISGLVGFAKAAELSAPPKHANRMACLRDKIIETIKKEIPEAKLNGPEGDKRLCNNINFTFPVNGELLGEYLSAKGICVSKASACANIGTEKKPSHVLLAIGRTPEEANNSLRLTLSRFTTEEEIDFALDVLIKSVKELKKESLLGKILKRIS